MEAPSDNSKSSKYVHNSEEYQHFDDHPIVSQLQTSVPPRQLVEVRKAFKAYLYEKKMIFFQQSKYWYSTNKKT